MLLWFCGCCLWHFRSELSVFCSGFVVAFAALGAYQGA